MNSTLSSFAKNLRTLREQAGETQGQLGEAISLTKNEISFYENGKREPRLDTLRRIAAHYGVSIDLLLRTNYYDIDYSKELTANIIERAADTESFSLLLPLWTPPKEIGNKRFKRAYALIQEAIHQMQQGNSFSSDSVSEALTLIMNAKDEGCIEALYLLPPTLIIGYISMIVNFAIKYETENQYSYYDLNYREQLQAKAEADRREEYLRKNHEFLLASISYLRSGSTKALGDYYWALIHCLGIGSIAVPLDIESIIGHQMLSDLAIMENTYAEQVVSIYTQAVEATFKEVKR